jgi:hypothetical protein
MVDDYLEYIVLFLSIGIAPYDMEVMQKKQFVVKVVDYKLIAGSLSKLGTYGILR